MKRLSISWSKKPTKGVFIEQLKAILNAYHIALSENIKPSELYLSVSPLAHSMLHKLCTVQSSFMPSIIATFCGLTVIENKTQNDYALELKQKEKTREIEDWEQEYKEAMREYYKSIRKK